MEFYVLKDRNWIKWEWV